MRFVALLVLVFVFLLLFSFLFLFLFLFLCASAANALVIITIGPIHTHAHTNTHTDTRTHTSALTHTHTHIRTHTSACCSHPGSLSFFFFSLGTIVIIRIRAALDSDDTEHKLLKLTPEQRYAICREAAKKVSGGDISPYIDKTMPPLGKEGLSAWCRAAGMACLHAFQSVRCWLQAHPFAFSPRCCPLPLVRVCAFSNL